MRRMRPVSPVLALLLACGASAQPVEQGVADVDPAATSMRYVDPGLRQESDFELVHRLPGDEARFARRAGAVTAVFPRSEYYAMRKGVLTAIPGGTVFYIGALPELDGAPSTTATSRPVTPTATERIDLRTAPALMGVRAGATIATGEGRGPSITMRETPVRTMSDETYRRERLRRIAERLAPAE